jgi:hypothetical protein
MRHRYLSLLRAGLTLKNHIHFSPLSYRNSPPEREFPPAREPQIDINIRNTPPEIKSRLSCCPAPLPPPIIFDGPSQPANLPSQLQNGRRVHSPLSRQKSEPRKALSFVEPSVELFDGPSRISRHSAQRVRMTYALTYSFSSFQQKKSSKRKLICIVIAAGGAAACTMQFT